MTFTPSELLAVMGSRQLKNDTTVFAGVGVPLLAAALAQQRHAPQLTMVIEGGIIGPRIKPGRLPISTNEMRAAHQAQMLPAITDTFLFAQRGFLDYGFMGGEEKGVGDGRQHLGLVGEEKGVGDGRQHLGQRAGHGLLASQGAAARNGRRQRHRLAV